MRPARRRRLVDEVRADWKVSIRRACATFLIDTSLYHYKSKRGEQADLKSGSGPDACTLRLQARPCAAAPGGLGGQSEANLSPLQGDGLVRLRSNFA